MKTYTLTEVQELFRQQREICYNGFVKVCTGTNVGIAAKYHVLNAPSPLLPTEEVGIKEDDLKTNIPKKDFESAKAYWKSGDKLNAVKIIHGILQSLKDSKKFCEDNFNVPSDNNNEGASVASHSCTIGNSIEQLLKPRYKVMALWPGSWMIKEGDILMEGVVNNKPCWRVVFPQNDERGSLSTIPTVHGPEFMPHLFKKLEWWEEREPEEMPKYLKHEDGEIVEVAAWDFFKGERVAFRDKRLTYFEWLNPKAQPATKEEYEQSLLNTNHQQ